MSQMTVPDSEMSTSREVRRWRVTSVAIYAAVVVMVLIQVAGFLYTRDQQERLTALRSDTRELRIAQQAMTDAEVSVANYLATGETSYLQSYSNALDNLQSRRDSSLRALKPMMSLHREGLRATPGAALDRVIASWDAALATRGSNGSLAAAQQLLLSSTNRQLLSDLRGAMARYLAYRSDEGERFETRIRVSGRIVLALQILFGTVMILGLAIAFRLGAIEAGTRRRAVTAATLARAQVEHLFQMADTLQSASGYADANSVLRATAEALLPEYGGSLYIFNNSRDRLDLSTSWNEREGDFSLPTIAPHQCWALKRGKQHVNSEGVGALRCDHPISHMPMLEIPMMARGEVHGLLQIHALSADDSDQRLCDVQLLATALADGMSLALSNLALREKLRNQALRDPLTGLYNRRYMEDMLDRLSMLAERNGSPLSVVMIDLDHFKRLNDERGHATGDAVLRDAATALAGGLRQSDVACRYGGEELILLLPDCSLDDAVLKAEILRARIEALSEQHGIRITASFGVSCTPETSQQSSDLVAQADAALYRSKSEGRNRVSAAPRRQDLAPPVLVRAAE